jgi:hypothetical protein
MNTVLKTLATAGAFAVAATGAWAAGEEETGDHKFEKAAEYYGQCEGADVADFEQIQEDVKAFTDMEVMAATLNDPEKLFKLMDVVNDPHTIHVMVSCATEPVMWDTWMENATSLDKWVDASAALMNPEGMVKWMVAPVNGEVWKSAANHLNPDKYVKWGNSLINPTFYSPVTNMLDLEWYEPRIEWIASAESYAPMLGMFGLDNWATE